MRNYSWNALRTNNSLSFCGLVEEKLKGLTEINLEYLLGKEVMLYPVSLDLFHLLNQHLWRESHEGRDDNKEKDIFLINWHTV